MKMSYKWCANVLYGRLKKQKGIHIIYESPDITDDNHLFQDNVFEKFRSVEIRFLCVYRCPAQEMRRTCFRTAFVKIPFQIDWSVIRI